MSLPFLLPISPALAIAAGALLALLSAACLTPRRWWQRPTLAAMAFLLLCGAGYSFAVWRFAGNAHKTAQLPAFSNQAATPALGYFRVQQALHLRASTATFAPLLARLPAQQLVWATGQRDGDWWQVCSELGTGWVSSLWLRRLDEMGMPPRASATQLPKCEMRKP